MTPEHAAESDTGRRQRDDAAVQTSCRQARMDELLAAIGPARQNWARVWAYLLGSKDNFLADRHDGDQMTQLCPALPQLARADRLFLGRAVRLLAGAGIRQFLDIGAGLPVADNTHQVAQRVIPDARVVYVDNDPLVLAHARALLYATGEGVCQHVDADLRDPDRILEAAAQSLDLARPVAILLLGILQFVHDDQAYDIVGRLLKAVPPGSHLAVTHLTSIVHGAATQDAVGWWNEGGGPELVLRSSEQIARFFDGLALLEPGVVSVSHWRPEVTAFGRPPAVDMYGGVARIPGGAHDQ